MTQQWHHRREDGKGVQGFYSSSHCTYTHPFAHTTQTKHDYECRQRSMHYACLQTYDKQKKPKNWLIISSEEEMIIIHCVEYSLFINHTSKIPMLCMVARMGN